MRLELDPTSQAAVIGQAADLTLLLDGDGDIDVLSASFVDDTVAWYENLDGVGGFGPQRVISRDADNAQSVFAADVDGDGDVDVLAASERDNTVALHVNDGAGNFTKHVVDGAARPDGERGAAIAPVAAGGPRAPRPGGPCRRPRRRTATPCARARRP